MAYDRYDTRHGPRGDAPDRDWRGERGQGSGWGRESGGGRDDRGWFERAGEEISSWFGSDHDDRGNEHRSGRESGWGRERRDDDHRGAFGGQDDHRGSDPQSHRRSSGGGGQERFSGRDPWASSGRDYNPAQREMWGGGDRSQQHGRGGYRPMTGDYGRSHHDQADDSHWSRDPYRGSSYTGSSRHDAGRSRDEHDHDPHYRSWRQQQMAELDREYEEYRQEHRSRFEQDFQGWRERRQQKRGLLGQIREHMEVVGSDDAHVGTVDRVTRDRIILTQSDPQAGGMHHSLSCSSIDRVEGDRVVLDCTADKARKEWRDENQAGALFEERDQSESGPHILGRSFEGTYRS